MLVLLMLWKTVESLDESRAGICRLLGESGRPMMDCSRQGLTVLPRPPEGIMALRMSRNPLGFLARNVFLDNQARHLTELYLDHCDLHSISEGAFFAMENLQVLDLSHNHLTQLSPTHFISLLRLDRLVLSHNALITVPDFRPLLRLRHGRYKFVTN